MCVNIQRFEHVDRRAWRRSGPSLLRDGALLAQLRSLLHLRAEREELPHRIVHPPQLEPPDRLPVAVELLKGDGPRVVDVVGPEALQRLVLRDAPAQEQRHHLALL